MDTSIKGPEKVKEGWRGAPLMENDSGLPNSAYGILSRAGIALHNGITSRW